VQNFLKIGSGVPELENPEKWHFPLKAFIALTTVLRGSADTAQTVMSNTCVSNAKSSQNNSITMREV